VAFIHHTADYDATYSTLDQNGRGTQRPQRDICRLQRRGFIANTAWQIGYKAVTYTATNRRYGIRHKIEKLQHSIACVATLLYIYSTVALGLLQRGMIVTAAILLEGKLTTTTRFIV
jgi:hypothetical protein